MRDDDKHRVLSRNSAWNHKRLFFEKMLTEYKNNYNGKIDDCVMIFGTDDGSIRVASNNKDGLEIEPFKFVGMLESAKHIVLNDTYSDDDD